MKCPNCGGDLKPAKRDGIEVETCASCNGMWLSPQELETLEDEAFDLGRKGSLVFNPEPSDRQCPGCQARLQRFQYRDYDLELEFCPQGHGYWLDQGEDRRVLQLMKQEEDALARKYAAEDSWSAHLRHWRTPDFIDRLRKLLG